MVLTTYELEAWAGLDDAQRAGCVRGNVVCGAAWLEATEALEAEAAEQEG